MNAEQFAILKSVSRSFYLSLRFLPAPMRESASIAYLLARLSDTIADSGEMGDISFQLNELERFNDCVKHQQTGSFWHENYAGKTTAGEEVLLQKSEQVLQLYLGLKTDEQHLVQEVVLIIIQGQMLDLKRFSGANKDHIIALKHEHELDEYTWLVAGCVGAFWTKLGFLTLGLNFSSMPQDQAIQLGILYGKALQLVNILRDVKKDRILGRCYLPVDDVADLAMLQQSHAHWLNVAKQYLSASKAYVAQLQKVSLRFTTRLPSLIGEETIQLMQDSNWSELQEGVKVPRHKIYLLMLKALFSPKIS